MAYYKTLADMPQGMRDKFLKQTGAYDDLEARIAARDAAAEKKLQRDCENHLRQLEIEFTHLKKDVKLFPGCPDLRFGVNGYDIACELKTWDGKLSDDQEKIKSRMESRGTFYFVVRDFEHFVQIIAFFQKQTPARKNLFGVMPAKDSKIWRETLSNRAPM